MKAVREEAAQAGYEPVRKIPRMDVDNAFKADVQALTSRSNNAAKDFGDVVDSDVKPLVDSLLKVKSFTGDTAVDAVAVLREKASDLYAKGDKSLGGAYRKAAEAIEAQIERGLAKNGKNGSELIKDFRAARTKMAQTFDVEKALREGEGKVDARVLGKLFNKNPGKLSGELRDIGRTAASMPEAMSVPKSGWANPITALDSGFATFGGILAGNPAPLAYPALRALGRYGLLSGPGQSLTKPSYGPNPLLGTAAGLLDNPMSPYLGGLLGYELSP